MALIRRAAAGVDQPRTDAPRRAGLEAGGARTRAEGVRRSRLKSTPPIIVIERLQVWRREGVEHGHECGFGKTLEKFVNKLVATGRYHSKSEVLREGVRLIQERETRLAALDASTARGVADADMGRLKPASEVFHRLEAKLKTKADRR
jgi:antitoxin ParD1/3/4